MVLKYCGVTQRWLTTSLRAGWQLPARDYDRGDQTGCDHRQPADERRALHAGQGPHLREHPIVELDALQRPVVLRPRQRHIERQHVRGLKPGSIACTRQTARIKRPDVISRTTDIVDFNRDQNGAEALLRAAACADALAKRSESGATAGANRGKQTESECRERREQRREGRARAGPGSARWRSAAWGNEAGNSGTPTTATSRPAAPPSERQDTLSVTSCRISRSRRRRARPARPARARAPPPARATDWPGWRR